MDRAGGAPDQEIGADAGAECRFGGGADIKACKRSAMITGRRRGIALALTNKAVDYLKSIGCTTVVIHASDAGEPVYRAAGFELAKEMRLKFPEE